MSWIAAAIAGSAVVGAVASNQAGRTQASAANRATDTQQAMFNQTRDDQAPWRAAGSTSLGSIMGGLGLGPTSGGVPEGYFNHQFNNKDLTDNLAPNYQFMRDQGIGATTNMANAMGGLGGNSLADIAKFTTGYAQNAYQQAYANYTANQTNIYNRLASISGLGQTAGSNQTTGGSNYAGGMANTITGAGNARAAGLVGGANAITGAVNNGMGWYQLGNILNPSTGGANAANGVSIPAGTWGGGP